MQDEPDNTWRSEPLKDNTWVEGIKNSGEHVHYENSGGSDRPVNWRNETTGESVNLRNTSLSELRDRGLI